MQYTKSPLTFGQQIALLQSRGLIVSDVLKAESYLSNIGYYRLSAYMLPYKVIGADQFLPNTTFEDVIQLYLFDREFRVFLFDYIERLEIVFRTQLIYHYTLIGGAWWFENPNYFDSRRLHRKHLKKIDEEVDRAKEVFKDHFYRKYTTHLRMPAWMSFELSSLGTLSKLFKNLKMSKAKRSIARHFGLHPYVFESWLQSLTYIRNTCAHHGRVWNRILTIKPAYPQTQPANLWISQNVPNDKMYYFVCCILYLLRSTNPNTRFIFHFRQLLARYHTLPLSVMGFPASWDSDQFWK